MNYWASFLIFFFSVYYARCIMWYIMEYLWDLPSSDKNIKRTLLAEYRDRKIRKRKRPGFVLLKKEDGIHSILTHLFWHFLKRNGFLTGEDAEFISWKLKDIVRKTHHTLIINISGEVYRQLKKNNGLYDSKMDWSENPYDKFDN